MNCRPSGNCNALCQCHLTFAKREKTSACGRIGPSFQRVLTVGLQYLGDHVNEGTWEDVTAVPQQTKNHVDRHLLLTDLDGRKSMRQVCARHRFDRFIERIPQVTRSVTPTPRIVTGVLQ
jgi:hypothetical protein